MASIQGIYLAFFGRPADPLGLAYWEEQTNDGADLSVMLDALSGTEEYQDRFVGMSNEEVIQSIYQALFGRDAEPDGLAHFLEALENGTQTLGSIAVNILDGAQGSDLAMIENKVAAADIFTASLDTPEEIEAYSGNEAADFGRLFLSTVTEDPETVPTAETVQEQIDADLPDYTPPGAGAPGGGGGGGGGTPPPSQKELLLKWQAEQNAAYVEAGNDGQDEEVNTDGVLLANAYVEYLAKGNSPILDIVHEVVDGEGNVTRAQTFHDNVLGHLLELHFGEDAWRPVENVRTPAAEAFATRPWNGGYEPDEFHEADAWDILNDIKRPDLVKDLTNAAFTTADLAADHKFEPSLNIDSLISEFASDGRLQQAEFDTLAKVAGVENAFKFVWDYVDDNYSYYNEAINSVGVDLGIIYATYLQNNGDKLTDVVKFTPDTNESGVPDRLQELHDNILGNLDKASIIDKFGDTSPADTFEDLFSPDNVLGRIDGAGHGDFIGDEPRPIYGGYEGTDRTATIEWDNDHFVWFDVA